MTASSLLLQVCSRWVPPWGFGSPPTGLVNRVGTPRAASCGRGRANRPGLTPGPPRGTGWCVGSGRSDSPARAPRILLAGRLFFGPAEGWRSLRREEEEALDYRGFGVVCWTICPAPTIRFVRVLLYDLSGLYCTFCPDSAGGNLLRRPPTPPPRPAAPRRSRSIPRRSPADSSSSRAPR